MSSCLIKTFRTSRRPPARREAPAPLISESTGPRIPGATRIRADTPGGYPNAGPGGYPNPGNAAYGQGYYYRPGRDPNASDKSRLVALLLAWFFGVIGVHRFYVGKIGSGVAMIFTLGGLGIWTLVDIIMIAAGSFTDIDGRPVTVWDTAN